MAHLDLVIGPDTDASPADGLSVRGVVRTDDGVETPFVGWVGLLALLQRAVSGGGAPAATRAPTTG